MTPEIAFIVSMRDQASSVLKQLGANTQGVGQAARQAKGDLEDLERAAIKAGTAIAEIFASNKMLTGGLDAFKDYERQMSVVEKVTGMGTQAMKDFEEAFDKMAVRVGGMDLKGLQNVAGQAAQLGMRSSDDILKFTNTMAKLSMTTATVGENGAKEFARLLYATNTAATGADHFASVLTDLGKSTAATEGHILHMSSTLATSIAQFHMAGESVLGLASAAASLDIPARLFGTSMSRTLLQLNSAALAATDGMKDLTAMTGVTAEQMKALVKEDPAKAVMIFASALHKISEDGKDPLGFLTKFHLQAQENVRTLGSMAENIEMFKKSLETARSSSGTSALDQEVGVTMKNLATHFSELDKQWTITKAKFGEALAPVAITAIDALAKALEVATDAFKKLPDGAKEFMAWTAVMVPAAFGVATAIGALKTAWTIFSGVSKVAGIVEAATSVGTVATAAETATTAVGKLTTALGFLKGIVPAALGGIIAGADEYSTTGNAGRAGAVGVGGAAGGWAGMRYGAMAGAAAGSLVGPWGTAIGGAVGGAAGYFGGGYLGEQAGRMGYDFFDPAGGEEARKKWEEAKNAKAEEEKRKAQTQQNKVTVDLPTVNSSAVTALGEADEKALEKLDHYRKALEEIKKEEEALQHLKALPDTDPRHASDAEIARLQQIINLKKIANDPAAQKLKQLGQEADAAAAVTNAEKEELQIQQAIREVMEKKGAITDEETAKIRAQVQELNKVRQAAAYDDLARQLQQGLAQAKALTAEDRVRLEITQKITDFERQNGKLLDSEKETIAQMIGLTRQLEAEKALKDRLDPQSQANRSYQEDLQTIQRMSASAQEKQRLIDQLNRSTQGARDPIGKEIDDINRSNELLKIGGQYKEADVKTQQKLNELMQQGVSITQEQADALKQANRAHEDMTKETQYVQKLQDQLTGVADNFASGLSDAIGNALDGKKDSFKAFLHDFGRELRQMALKNLMNQIMGTGGAEGQGLNLNNLIKNAFSGLFGNVGNGTNLLGGVNAGGISGVFGSLFGGQGTAAGDAAKQTADAVSQGMKNVATMTVTASVVYVNGGVGGGIGTGAGGIGGAAGAAEQAAGGVSGEVGGAAAGVGGGAGGAAGVLPSLEQGLGNFPSLFGGSSALPALAALGGLPMALGNAPTFGAAATGAAKMDVLKSLGPQAIGGMDFGAGKNLSSMGVNTGFGGGMDFASHAPIPGQGVTEQFTGRLIPQSQAALSNNLPVGPRDFSFQTLPSFPGQTKLGGEIVPTQAFSLPGGGGLGIRAGHQPFGRMIPPSEAGYNTSGGIPANVPTPPQRPEIIRMDEAAKQATSAPQVPSEAMKIKDISNLADFKAPGLTGHQGFIFHHTGGGGGGPESVVNTLNQRGLGVQYVMDRNGQIFRTLPEGMQGAHIRNGQGPGTGLSNRNTEGMEIMAKDDSDILPAQVESAKKFWADYQKKFPDAKVFGHGEINPHKMATEGHTVVDAIRHGKAPTPTGLPEEAHGASLAEYMGRNPAASKLSSGSGNAVGNEDFVMNYLMKEKGLNVTQASTFAAQFKGESGYNPNAFHANDAGPGKHSYGMGQWNRDRADALQEHFRKTTGKDMSQLSDVDKMKGQMDFAVNEAKTKYGKAFGEIGSHPGNEAGAFGRAYEGYDEKSDHNSVWRNKEQQRIFEKYKDRNRDMRQDPAGHMDETTKKMQEQMQHFGSKPKGFDGNVDYSPTGSIRKVAGQTQNMTANFQKQTEHMTKQFHDTMIKGMKPLEKDVTKQFGDMGNKIKDVQGFKQLPQEFTQLGQGAQQATQSASQLSGGVENMASTMGQQGVQATESFTQQIEKLIEQMSNGMGGGLGGIGEMLGGLFHEGGVVGDGAPASGFRVASASAWTHAPRFHSGGGKGINSAHGEYAAILQRGERVLTQAQDTATRSTLEGLASHVEKLSAKGSMPGQGAYGNKVNNNTLNFNYHAGPGDSFRRNSGQGMAMMQHALGRMSARLN